MSEDKKQNLLLMFDRPLEPSFMVKKDSAGNNVRFDVPMTFMIDRYQPMGNEIMKNIEDENTSMIPVSKMSLPSLGEVLDLSRKEHFSLFLPKHRKLSGRLIDIFLGMCNVDDLQSMALFARDRVNPYLFNYALSVAILHRKDTQDLDLPSVITSFPDEYIESSVLSKAREELNIFPDTLREPIEIPRDYTASDLEPEHRLAYFREDLGINLHHWHWHLVYPISGDRSIVDKNRRGELFYYMHQQIIARFNFERLCNKMNSVERWSDWKAPIAEAYFPKLNSLVSSRGWPGRVANQKIQNLNRRADRNKVDVDDLIRWRDRIYTAIHSGFVIGENGQQIPLTENEGIDILGNIVEASILSPNPTFYGDMHNMGHVFLSYIHDPDHRHLENFGVMGGAATAMRDPIFYRWHAYVDNLFQDYKATLPKYTVAQLNYVDVTVQGIKVTARGGSPNVINTFWQQSDIDLSRGMDFQPRGSVFARFTHLQHQPFTYNITVNNQGSPRTGTCRIFMAPKFDEKGDLWLFHDQRTMFIELDKFRVNLRQGMNTLTRNSNQSTVTIPFERSFRNLDNNRPTGGDALAQFNFCGCGWPEHMLIPMGSPEGYQVELFVMISNYEGDRVKQTLQGSCNDAESYCGIKDKLYPDKRSMGYPFDRMPRNGVDTLQQFLTPNMKVQECIIKFSDHTATPFTRNKAN